MSDEGYDTDYEGRPSDELAQQLAAKKPGTFQCAICLETCTRTHCLLHKQVGQANMCKADICWDCFRRHVQAQAKRQENDTEVFPRCPLCRGRLVTYVSEGTVHELPSFLVSSKAYLLKTLGRKYRMIIILFEEQFGVAFEQGPITAIVQTWPSPPVIVNLNDYVDAKTPTDELPTIDTVYQSIDSRPELEDLLTNAKVIGTIYDLNIN